MNLAQQLTERYRNGIKPGSPLPSLKPETFQSWLEKRKITSEIREAWRVVAYSDNCFCFDYGEGYRKRLRFSDGKTKDFRWTNGEEPIGIYGANVDSNLKQVKEKKYVWLVEGETDSLSLASIEEPVYGIPAATMSCKLTWDMFDDVRLIYLSIEPDAGGVAFKKGVLDFLNKEGLDIAIQEVNWKEYGFNDPSEALQQSKNIDTFKVFIDCAKNNTKAEAPKTEQQKPKFALIPGPHKTDKDEYIEQSSSMFSEQVLNRLPQGSFYRRDRIPGELLGLPGERRFSQATPDRVRIVVDKNLSCRKWVKQNDERFLVYKPCTRDLAGLVIAGAAEHNSVRKIEHLTSYPTYRRDWSLAQPGWNDDGVYYDEQPGLDGLKPMTCADRIREVLLDLVIDFPFADNASRDNFFGLLLTPLIVFAVDGNRPLSIIVSPLERTGKSKLAEEVFGGIITGRQTPSMQLGERDEERDKRVLALLLAGETLLHLDNLPSKVDSATLASTLTSSQYQGRILGTSVAPSLPNYLTIVASGNNVQATGEIAKRTIPICLQPADDCPERRQDFVHPDLRDFVRKTRRRTLEALLGAVELWKAGGRKRLSEKRLGGFENWSEIVGSILEGIGFTDWRNNESEWRRKADTSGQEIETFLEHWHNKHKNMPVPADKLLEVAEEAEVFDWILNKPTERSQKVALGSYLKKHIIERPWKSCLPVTSRTKYGTTYFLKRLNDDAQE